MTTRTTPAELVAALVRRPWITGVVCVLVCASFAARAAGHVLEAALLADPSTSPALPTVGPPPPAPIGTGTASALVERNMFCSACTPEGAGDPISADGDAIATSKLPLLLVATSLARTPEQSYATIRNLDSGAMGAFWIGQRLPGGGVLEKVAGTFVWVRRDAGAVEQIDLLAVAVAAAPAPVATAKVEGKPAAAWADRLRMLDDHTFEVDRALLRELMNAQAKVPGVRIAPAMKAGKLAGVRVSQARKDSLAAALGLRSGDVIEAIDGTALDSPDVLLAMYGQLDRASAVQVSVSRAGKPVQLDYRLR